MNWIVNRIKFVFFAAMLYTDVFFVNCASWVVYYSKEWFSWTRSGIEKVLIAGYPACWWVMSIVVFNHTFHARFFTIMVRVFCPIFALAASFFAWHVWEYNKDRSDHSRMFLLFYIPGVAVRVAAVVFSLAMITLEYLTPPCHWSDGLPGLSLGFFAAYNYVSSIPESGEKGRRRKLALDKVKEMFGTSWVPVEST
jgi:hypothetical protein